MRINHKILSIPPYISTSWKNVLSLHMELREEVPVLIVGLVSGSTIEIPNLDKITLQAAFAAHEKHLEQEQSPVKTAPAENASTIIGLPFGLRMEGMEIGNILQHNQEAAHTPDLPKEVLEKIASLAKVVGLDSQDTLPRAEPHCNCVHCQILRALSVEPAHAIAPTSDEQEEVLDVDLKFRDWDIRQSADKLYLVANPLNKEEHYNVFLGNPIGCTCGEKNCEHIRAVLNS